ncbi:MAG: hypothetical protein AB1730_07110 [Myxococcota bacterium]
MFTRRDRFELAVLGLVALGWGLVLAPVLHAVEHAHGHAHHHGAPASQPRHGDGSVEHQQAVFLDPPAAPVLGASWRPLPRVEPARPDAPDIAPAFRPEQPQGP